MKELDLTSLRYFVAACDAGSISKAARQESISVSAVSKRLAQLEDDLGTSLLMPRRTTITPTPAGKLLLDGARQLLASAHKLQQDVGGVDLALAGQIRIVAAASAFAEHLPQDIGRFLARGDATGVRINVDTEHGSGQEIVDQVREGVADLGVVWDVAEFGALQTREYRTDHLAVVVKGNHPLAQAARCSFKETLRFDRVGLQASSAVSEVLVRKAADLGATVVPKAMVATFDAALQMVSDGIGLCILPQEIATPQAQRLGLRVVPLVDSWATRRFVICFRGQAKLSRAATEFIDFLFLCGAESARPVAPDATL